jgi:Tubulin-tyrosine ligase family
MHTLCQIKKWSSGRVGIGPGGFAGALGGAGIGAAGAAQMKEAYLISRYIEDPLLIGGKKFDLRL